MVAPLHKSVTDSWPLFSVFLITRAWENKADRNPLHERLLRFSRVFWLVHMSVQTLGIVTTVKLICLTEGTEQGCCTFYSYFYLTIEVILLPSITKCNNQSTRILSKRVSWVHPQKDKHIWLMYILRWCSLTELHGGNEFWQSWQKISVEEQKSKEQTSFPVSVTGCV